MTIVYFHDDDSNEDNSYHKIGVQLVNVDERIRTQVERLVKAAVAEAQTTETIFWRLNSLYEITNYQRKQIRKVSEESSLGAVGERIGVISDKLDAHLQLHHSDINPPIYKGVDLSHDDLVADVDAKPMSSFVVPSVDGRDNPDDVIRAAPVDGRDVL